MDPAVRRLLESADDPDNVEYPRSFDWNGLRNRVIALQPVLESIAGRAFVLDDNVQDASFFGDLEILAAGPEAIYPHAKQTHVVFALRFSNFAGLFSSWNHGEEWSRSTRDVW